LTVARRVLSGQFFNVRRLKLRASFYNEYYVEAGFEKLMDTYGVDVVLAGHDHVYARSYLMLNGVPDKTGASGQPKAWSTHLG